MSASADEYDWHNSLPHPRWQSFFENIESLPISEKSVLTTNFVSRWLRELAGALGSQAGVALDKDMFCLYSSEQDQPERLLRWSSNALARIISIVGDHRTPEMFGPRIVMLYSDLDRYYDYVDKFYSASGEFGASAGMCIAHEYFHVVVGPGGFGTRQDVLAHELTHLALGPLPLPLWLNEGLAQMMQEVLLGIPRFRIDRELVQRHKSCWQKVGLQVFWNGDSFDGDMEELSYHLAEVLARNILAAHRGSFIEFLSRAQWRDAGDAAAREVLGCSLGEIAAQFLGPGNWSPQPIQIDPAMRP